MNYTDFALLRFQLRIFYSIWSLHDHFVINIPRKLYKDYAI